MQEERSQGSAEEHAWMDDDLGEGSDPAATCDEDVADLSDTFESASDSYDSDADYFEPRSSEPAEDEPTALLLSKDKTIQYFPMDLTNRFLAAPVDTFEAKQGPTSYAKARCVDIASMFLMFIEPFEKIVVDMTNLYGARTLKDEWNPVDIVTMRAYYGLLLMAGSYRGKHEYLEALWDEVTGRPVFPSTMSLYRFKQISRCIRFDDRTCRDGSDKLAPIRNIYEKWLPQLKKAYRPGKCITVDEMMLPFKGKVPFKQRVPSKAYLYGIRIWVVADSQTHYAYNLRIYEGKDRKRATDIDQSERVVLDMTEGLDGRNVTTKHRFTSRALAIKLKTERNMTLVGAIRKSRNEVPPQLLNISRKPVDHTEAVYESDLTPTALMLSYKSSRHKSVTLFSNYHSFIKFSGDNRPPNVVQFYNVTKNAVDELSSLISAARCKKRVNRWPVAIFCNMLDVSALNAFTIFSHIVPEWGAGKPSTRRRFLFVCNLGDALCAPYAKARQGMPHDDFDLEVPHFDKLEDCVKCAKLASLSDLYTKCMACRERDDTPLNDKVLHSMDS